jgi:hypothetical protein
VGTNFSDKRRSFGRCNSLCGLKPRSFFFSAAVTETGGVLDLYLEGFCLNLDRGVHILGEIIRGFRHCLQTIV